MQATATVKYNFEIPTPTGIVEMPRGSTHIGAQAESGDFVFWLETPGGRLVKTRIAADSDKITVQERKLPG